MKSTLTTLIFSSSFLVTLISVTTLSLLLNIQCSHAGRIRKKYFNKIFYDFVQPVPVYLIQPEKYLNIHMIDQISPHDILIKIRKEELKSKRKKNKVLSKHRPFTLVLNNVEPYYPLSPPPIAEHEVVPEHEAVPEHEVISEHEPIEGTPFLHSNNNPHLIDQQDVHQYSQPEGISLTIPVPAHPNHPADNQIIKMEKVYRDQYNHQGVQFINNHRHPYIIRPEGHISDVNDRSGNSVAKIQSVQSDDGSLTHEIDIPTDQEHSGPVVIDLSDSASTIPVSTQSSVSVTKDSQSSATTSQPMVTYTFDRFTSNHGSDDHEAKASSASIVLLTEKPPLAQPLTSTKSTEDAASATKQVTTATTIPMTPVVPSTTATTEIDPADTKLVTFTAKRSDWTPVVQLRREDVSNLKAVTQKLIASALASRSTSAPG